MMSTSSTSAALWGAAVAWVAIFLPGMMLVHGTMGVWGAVRERRAVRAALWGVNAGAVGLVFTAVSRIWGVGFLDGGGSGEFFSLLFSFSFFLSSLSRLFLSSFSYLLFSS